MNVRKWVAVTAAVGAIAITTAFAFTNPIRVFRTVVAFVTVQQEQGTDLLQYEYNVRDGVDLSTLALGTAPTSNQVFAMQIDCSSSQAYLVCFDKSVTNVIATIAQSTSFTTVRQQIVNLRKGTAGHTNDERFVAEFNMVPQNNLAGGFLTVAGRLHLDTNGCPVAVLITFDHDPYDSTFGDKDVTDTEQDAKIPDMYRAGQAHFVGVVDAISSNAVSGVSTNPWLIPFGHMSFRHQLDQFNEE